MSPESTESNTALRTAAPLYKTHSRNVRAAPRFSPTRFIPSVAISAISLDLDYLQALRDKTLYVGHSLEGEHHGNLEAKTYRPESSRLEDKYVSRGSNHTGTV